MTKPQEGVSVSEDQPAPVEDVAEPAPESGLAASGGTAAAHNPTVMTQDHTS